VSTTEYTAVVRATPDASEKIENSVNIGEDASLARASRKLTRRAYSICRGVNSSVRSALDDTLAGSFKYNS
jgi:hypothetical protein